MIFKFKNIHFDKNSRHKFEQLNESLFLEKVIDQLANTMGTSFFNYEFYIFSHQGAEHWPSSVKTDSDKKKVLLFFSDELGIDPKPYSNHYHAIFKAYIGNLSTAKNVFPLPLGYVKDVPQLPIKPINERSVNVFFRGNFNNNRLDFYRSLSKFKFVIPKTFKKHPGFFRSLLMKFQNDFSTRFPRSIIRFNDGFKTGLTPKEYGKVLAESKIVLCPKGFDMPESFRHFESMRAGCVILSEKLPETEFYTDSPIIEVKNWTEGISKVNELLSKPAKMEILQKKIIEWWEKKCSEIGTAKYIHATLLRLERSN